MADWKHVVSAIAVLTIAAVGVYILVKQQNNNKSYSSHRGSDHDENTKKSENEKKEKEMTSTKDDNRYQIKKTQKLLTKHDDARKEEEITGHNNEWKKKYVVNNIDFEKLRTHRTFKRNPENARKTKPIKMKKSKVQQRRELDQKMNLLVNGYCHRNGIFIVSNIVDIVFKYFRSSFSELKSQFIFNKEKKSYFVGDGVEFVDDNNVILRGPNIAMIDYMISNTNGNVFEWQIKMNTIGSSSYIGFVDADIFPGYPASLHPISRVSGFNDFVFDDESKKYGFCMTVSLNTSWFCRYSKYHCEDKEIECHITSYKLGRGEICVPHFRNGDIFRFRVNFAKRRCDLFVNDELFWEKIFIKIPNRIIAGVSNSGGISELNVTSC